MTEGELIRRLNAIREGVFHSRPGTLDLIEGLILDRQRLSLVRLARNCDVSPAPRLRVVAVPPPGVRILGGTEAD